MNLFLITHPTPINNEAEIINELFSEGLDILHLRKPGYKAGETEKLLNAIDAKHYSKIALHDHHSMAGKYKINRIHFSESKRLIAKEEELKKWKEKDFILSTSIHVMKDHNSLSDSFGYTFFGPVFESISKPGYKPQQEKVNLKDEKRAIKIIAIGGITSANIKDIKQLNFDGAAMLGAIWNDTTNAIKVFKECRKNANM